MNLKEVVLKGESDTLELKETLQLKDEIGESISAFSNSKGGVTLIGISDKRQKKALQYTLGKGFITNKIYRERNEVSHKTTHLDLEDLVQKGLLMTAVKCFRPYGTREEINLL